MENKNNENNPFSWNMVRMNLPSYKDYVTPYPWVSKVRKDGIVMSKVFIYLDGLRLLGWCDR